MSKHLSVFLFIFLFSINSFAQSYVIGGKTEKNDLKIGIDFFGYSNFSNGSNISFYLAREKAKKEADRWVDGVKIGDNLIYYGGKADETFTGFPISYLQLTYLEGSLLAKTYMIYGDGTFVGEEVVKKLKIDYPKFIILDRPFDSFFDGAWRRTVLFTLEDKYIYVTIDQKRVYVEFCTCRGRKVISDYLRDHKSTTSP